MKPTVHVHDSGIPYIKYDDIPERMRPEFNEWSKYDTKFDPGDGTTAVSADDWNNFLAHIEGREEFWD